MSGERVAAYMGSSLQGNAEVFDEKNRALTICAYTCWGRTNVRMGIGW
jgi:hypothetical protein